MDTTQLQNITSHSFTIQHVSLLCQKIIAAKYPPSFNVSGSLATVRDLPYMVTTNLFYKFGGKDGYIFIQKENVDTYKQALLYLQKSIQNEAHDIFNKGHHHGALRRNKETGLLGRPRHMCSTEMCISEESTTTLLDVLDSNIQSPEQLLRHRESYDLASFIDMLTAHTLRLNETSIMSELSNLPSLSPAGLIKYCMYTYGMDYASTAADTEVVHALIQTLWSDSTLPSAGLVKWNANLPAMKADLRDAEANFSFIVKQ